MHFQIACINYYVHILSDIYTFFEIIFGKIYIHVLKSQAWSLHVVSAQHSQD